MASFAAEEKVKSRCKKSLAPAGKTLGIAKKVKLKERFFITEDTEVHRGELSFLSVQPLCASASSVVKLLSFAEPYFLALPNA